MRFGWLILVAVTGSALAQTAAPKKPLAFEVVSIKVNKEGGPQTFGVTANGYQLRNLFIEIPIMTAYVPQTSMAMYGADQIVGMPFWASDERYDITAKVSDADLADWHDAKKQPAMLREMLQTMLTERMKLVVHRASKEGNVFELVVGKDGPKFKETNPAEHHTGQFTLPDGGVMSWEPRDGQVVTHLYAATIREISTMMLNDSGRQVVDKTGLTGKYDVTVQPSPLRTADGQAQAAAAMDKEPMAFTRVNELGLKLVPAKGQIETLVIDHMEKPPEN